MICALMSVSCGTIILVFTNKPVYKGSYIHRCQVTSGRPRRGHILTLHHCVRATIFTGFSQPVEPGNRSLNDCDYPDVTTFNFQQ